MAPDPHAPWSLAVGPGRRLAGIVPLLEALRGSAPAPTLLGLQDLADLLDPALHDEELGLARVVLDGDALPPEDLGLVLRSLDAGFETVVVGGDPTTATLRRLQAIDAVHWLPWPLDTDGLASLLRDPEGRDPEGALPDTPHAPEAPARPTWSEAWERISGEVPELSSDALESGPPDAERDDVPLAPDDFDEGAESADPDGLRRVLGDLPPAPAFPDDPELAAIEAILGQPGPGNAPVDVSEAMATGTETDVSPTVSDALDVEDGPEPDPFDTREPEAFLAARDAITLTRDEIDAFLGEPLDPDTPTTQAPSESSGPGAFEDDALEADATDSETGVTDGPVEDAPETTAPPGWYRDQVADLADQAQRIELGVRLARETQDVAALERLEGDVAGLLAFTRTLGFLAAPPARGNQSFDLATLVEEQLGGLASTGDDVPRIFFRGEPDQSVRADKGLVVLALDAVLQLAARCAGPEGVVHTSILPEGDRPGGAGPTVRIDFPAGPLVDRAPVDLLEPYAVHRSVPGMGPNALAAADRIVRGQGGRLALGTLEEGTLRFELDLPPDRRPSTEDPAGDSNARSTPGPFTGPPAG